MYLSAKIFVSFLITNALVHPNFAFVPSSNGRATSSKVTFVNNVKSSTVSFASNIDNDQVDIMKKKQKIAFYHLSLHLSFLLPLFLVLQLILPMLPINMIFPLHPQSPKNKRLAKRLPRHKQNQRP